MKIYHAVSLLPITVLECYVITVAEKKPERCISYINEEMRACI
jgi:hypothetical protein